MSMNESGATPGNVEDLVTAWLADSPDTGYPAGEALEEADPEIVASFVVECLDLLEEAEQSVLQLESHADDDSIDVVFRCFHTIKGTAAFLGLDHVSGIAHDAETLLGHIRDGAAPLSAEAVNLLIRSIDVLAESARNVSDHKPQPASVVQVRQALQAASGRTEAAADADTPSAVRPVDGTEAAGVSGMTPPEPAARTPGEGAQAESWTRVRTDRLDRLLETVGEMVVTQSILAREAGLTAGAASPLAALVVAAGKNVRTLQELSVGMRLVPLRSLFRRMDRLVHDLSRRSGKQVRLLTSGEDTEIDRNLIEELVDPLLHMLRNSVDHGIEPVAERTAAGKPETATLELTAFRRGGNVVLRLSDDGRGLDVDRVRGRAVERGWLSTDREPTEAEVLEFIFAPGFSTSATVTELSGRGVGLDVVRRNIQTLNGRVHVTSTLGSGCTFELEVPLTLAITDGMLIRVGDEDYILPIGNMLYSLQPDASSVRTVAGRGEMLVVADGIVPLVRLRDRLGLPPATEPPQRALVVLVAAGERRCALLVDQLIGQQQVVAKPLTSFLCRTRGVAGSAILGNGRVGLILDIAEILDDTA